jgi:exoribonuclease R
MRIPPFLIPYEIKHVGFSKVFTNIYVTFKFVDWNEKHPHGLITQSIGEVDVLDNYYEYQLYCKSLHASIQKFQKETTKALQQSSHDELIQNIRVKYPGIEDRTNQEWHILTIDPAKSMDFDDAFSIKEVDEIQQLSIYISNVTIWMEVLHLWDSFSRRISTIYLPDRKRPMLPTILSDCLCSLQEKNVRIALVMDIFVRKNTDIILDVKYSNCFIKVFKNYVYEESSLLKNMFGYPYIVLDNFLTVYL